MNLLLKKNELITVKNDFFFVSVLENVSYSLSFSHTFASISKIPPTLTYGELSLLLPQRTSRRCAGSSTSSQSHPSSSGRGPRKVPRGRYGQQQRRHSLRPHPSHDSHCPGLATATTITILHSTHPVPPYEAYDDCDWNEAERIQSHSAATLMFPARYQTQSPCPTQRIHTHVHFSCISGY